ncbi:mechanosensitive ion channel [Persicimonas caeni]|uniref:Mechanosensitive ion channel n=1 Tax=Persicimonas caeni TaxID=2292766 RepID=A0A4Y6Q1T9_PERCE|nr:mechanosensitive ion channel domain-containing protein [Persicimonas caeni]QDG54429.1 mechanosensitive ion channel [Persicimonas caeni]QED35650.1 mechanosensitive ion channel [Persicimonas caeni]
MFFSRDNQGERASHSRAPLRHALRFSSLLLVAFLVFAVAGCESPTEFFQSNPPEFSAPSEPGTTEQQTTEQETTDQKSAESQKAQAGQQEAEQKPKDTTEAQKDDEPLSAETLAVQVQSLEPGAEKAKRILERNFEGFLERQDLGFTSALPDMVLADLDGLGERVTRAPQRFQQMSPREIAFELFPALVALILTIVFALLDRAFLKWSKRWQARIHIDISRAATQGLRALVLVSGRVAPLLSLVILSYFPIQALAQQSPWSLFLTRALWLGVAYRAIHAAFVVTFSGRLIDVADEHALRLETYAIWVTRLIFGFLLALAAIETFEYHRQVFYFVRFCLELTVAFVPVYLFFVQPSVMALLPAYEGSRIYSFFRETIDRYYHWLLSVTVLLLLMRAAGFDNASTFILSRGYAIILLVIFAFVVGNGIKAFLRKRTEAIDAEEAVGTRTAETGPPHLAASLEKFLFVAGGLIVIVTILDLLAVREAVVALLRTPILAAGNVQISLFNVLAVGLIVFGTVLAIKILKAFLNAKVYPAFSVDVGIAYAINTLLSYVLVVIAFLMVLAAIGVNLSAIAVVLASLGVGIGFGLQTLTENLISGFIILFGRSVKKGDFITVRDTYGRVEAVGARSVVIRTPDNYDMLIPSKEIVGGQITNWTFRDSYVRMRIDVGVTYNADPSHVKEVLLDAAANCDLILQKPDPEVWLVGFGDSSVNFQLLVYYDCRQVSPFRLKGLIYFDIWDALHKADIEIPFPQRDIHVRTGEVLPEVAKMLRELRQNGEDAENGNLLPLEMDDEDKE